MRAPRHARMRTRRGERVPEGERALPPLRPARARAARAAARRASSRIARRSRASEHRWYGHPQRRRSCSSCCSAAARSRSSDAAAASGSGISPSAGIPRRTSAARRGRARPRRSSGSARSASGSTRRRVARTSRRRRRPGADRVDAALAVRPADPRPRPRRGALRLPLPARDVRAEGEARVRLLRAAAARRRPIVGRAEPVFDRSGKLELLGAWGDTSRLPEVLPDLEWFLRLRADEFSQRAPSNGHRRREKEVRA